MQRASKEETDRRMRALLEQKDDFRLFAEGGCAIFWRALHAEFGYACAWIPGYDEFAVGHVFAVANGDLAWGIDARGTASVDRLLKRMGGIGAYTLTIAQLDEMAADPRRGIYTEEWFTNPAMERAKSHIARYRPYFDGTERQEIPSGS